MASQPDTSKRPARRRPEVADPDDEAVERAPTADSTQWWKCPQCDGLHVVLIDAANDPIAKAIMDREMLVKMLATLDEPGLQ